MIREGKFLISRRPYAVDLSSWQREEWKTSKDGHRYAHQTVKAVWFRRKNGVTAANIGVLWDFSGADSAEDFLRLHDDGRHGGDCKGRWDGKKYWGAQEPEVIEEHLALLRPMLDGYPAIPPGFDGWYRF